MEVVLSDHLVYDESSRTGLRWKTDRFSGRGGCIKHVSAGDEAGSLDHKGEAYVVSLFGKHYRAHNVVVRLNGMDIPEGFVVDHIDGDCTNNVLLNLRVVTEVINAHNRRKQHNNSSGQVGVTWWTDQRGSLFALARWQDAVGKRGAKSYSVKKYGLLEAFAMATEYRHDMIKKLTEAGHGYTERHGK